MTVLYKRKDNDGNAHPSAGGTVGPSLRIQSAVEFDLAGNMRKQDTERTRVRERVCVCVCVCDGVVGAEYPGLTELGGGTNSWLAICHWMQHEYTVYPEKFCTA